MVFQKKRYISRKGVQRKWKRTHSMSSQKEFIWFETNNKTLVQELCVYESSKVLQDYN